MTALPLAASKEWTTLKLICASFAAAIVVYAAVGWLVVSKGTLKLPTPRALLGLALVLATLAVLLLLAAPLLQRLLAHDRDARPPFMPAVPFETFRQATIVAFAVREAAAIVGLVITLLTRDVRWVGGLAAVTLLAMLLGWPTRTAWERLNRQLERSPHP